MYRVKKIIVDNIELLPDIIDTPMWKDYDEINCNKSVRKIVALYNAIQKRENFYQLNSPTAFGDPQYKYYCGLVVGILQGTEMEEVKGDDKIIIKKNKNKILIIDKIIRTQGYYDSVKELNNIMYELGM